MLEHELLGPWLRRFLTEYIVTERNLARNTQTLRDKVAMWRQSVQHVCL